MATDAARLIEDGVAALRRGDGRGAQALLTRAAAAGGDKPPWLLLAQAARVAGDEAGEAEALERVLAADPGNVRGILMRGDQLYRAGDLRLATRFYDRALRLAAGANGLASDLRDGLARGERRIADQARAYEAYLRSRLTAAGHAKASNALAEALDILAGRARPHVQAPSSFYWPGLPTTPFHPREALPWIEAVEAAAPAVLQELRAAEADAFTPYVVADERLPPAVHSLLNSPDWSALHLLRNGTREAAAERFGRTLEVAALTPQPHIPGRTPMCMFSRLAPGAHIRPHTGLYNVRLIVHLALVTPGRAWLRCGNHVRLFEEGRAWAFDDSIEHEARNEGAGARTILLFDVWRPDLDKQARAEISALFGAIAEYGVEAPVEG